MKPARMFLHAHRLLMQTPMENLDLNAGDPFTRGEEGASWRADSEICDLTTAYTIIHSDTSDWKVVEIGA